MNFLPDIISNVSPSMLTLKSLYLFIFCHISTFMVIFAASFALVDSSRFSFASNNDF
jgi:hypothetical protein